MPDFEVLVPTGRPLTPPPTLGAHFLSLLLSASEAKITVEFDARNNVVLGNNAQVKEFLNMLRGARQFEAFVAQCRVLMFSSEESGTIGRLACQSAGRIRGFLVRELQAAPSLKWEISRIDAG